MNTKMKLLAVAVVAVPLMIGAALAQQGAKPAGPNQSAENTGKSTPAAVAVQNAALASELATYGRSSRNPMALVVAAQIEGGLGGTAAQRPKTSEHDAKAGPAGNKTGSKPRTTADSLFAEARQLAGADTALVAQINRAASRQSKGALGGPKVNYDRVLAYDTDSYSIAFRGGEYARVNVTGDHDTDLDLYVYDENGRLICSDTDYTDVTYCSFVPAWTGNFRIRIKNRGSVYNEYRLSTN